jgi:hypothetical protein
MDKKDDTPQKETRAEKLKRQLDGAMPMGFSTPMHRNPAYNESEMKAYANQIKTGKAGADGGNGFKKTAGVLGGAFVQSSQPNVGRTPLLYVDPMFDPILFLFPKDRIDEINKRLRHYYETDPIVGNAIDLHTESVISDFYLQCEDKNNEKYWNDFKDRSGLVPFLRGLIHDHWLLGEGVGLPIWDPHNFEFSHYNQYPPENVDIFRTYVTPTAFFMLKPDPDLAEKVQSAAQTDQTLINMMDSNYVESLKEGRPFNLGDDKKIIYLSRATTKYRHRGVSILARVLKDLLYKDKLRLLQLTFVDRHMFPIKIFKLGSESKGWIPNKRHFTKLQQLLAQASNDPDFNLIYHWGLQIDYVGTKDKIWNLIPEFEWVERQVMAGLFVNDELIHGGVPSAVRDTVNLRTLMHRYSSLRDQIERYMITHIFLPIAQARGMYRKAYKNAKVKSTRMIKIAGRGTRVPVEWVDSERGLYTVAHNFHAGTDLSAYDIPRPIWKRLNLVNNIAEQQLMLKLEEDDKLPLEMIYDMFGLDPRIIDAKMREQESTRRDKLWRQVRDDIGKDKNIRKQVLRGSKPENWVLPRGQELEAPVTSTAPAAKPKTPPTTPKPGAPAAKPATPPAGQPGGATPPTQPKPGVNVKQPPEVSPAPPTPPVGPMPPGA